MDPQPGRDDATTLGLKGRQFVKLYGSPLGYGRGKKPRVMPSSKARRNMST
jgi:hypothetical protein